jgi:hypothetical protein
MNRCPSNNFVKRLPYGTTGHCWCIRYSTVSSTRIEEGQTNSQKLATRLSWRPPALDNGLRRVIQSTMIELTLGPAVGEDWDHPAPNACMDTVLTQSDVVTVVELN